MITSSIDCPREAAFLAEPIRYAVAYLERTDLMQFAPGKYALDRPGYQMQVIDMETGGTEENPLEFHRRNIDLQFLASGEGEKIGYAPFREEYTIIRNRLEENDIAFLDRVSDETFIPMRTGTYCIFFPWDVHRPGCILDRKCSIRKIVIKISMDLLKQA